MGPHKDSAETEVGQFVLAIAFDKTTGVHELQLKNVGVPDTIVLFVVEQWVALERERLEQSFRDDFEKK